MGTDNRAFWGAVAGALILAGGAIAALGIGSGLTTALCPPYRPVSGNGMVAPACIGPDLLPWYWFLLPLAFTGAGVAVLTIGLLIYRRARTR